LLFYFILDASATTASSTTTKNFYLIHHQSSLVPIKNLLNQNLHHSNIEFIQMDEQECILEIVDGVVTLVPRVNSIPMNNDDDYDDEKFEEEEEEEKSSSEDQISQNNGKKKKPWMKLKYLESIINKIRNTTSVQRCEQMLI
jgi:hypothetical protein